MSNTSPSWFDRQLDRFADDFRHARQPSIESYLVDVPADQRAVLTRAFVERELQLRRAAGESPERPEYERRFPDLGTWLDQWFVRPLPANDATQQVLHHARSAPSYDTEIGPTSSVQMTTTLAELRFFRRGGLSTLYLGKDQSLHRETVVKFINEQCAGDPELVDQFRIEAELTGRLDHPGVVPVYGLGYDATNRPFYVMRLIRGRELRDVIREYHDSGGPRNDGRDGRRRLFALVEHLASACQTIAYAHDSGIVHCDLKPANIMVGRYDETYVLDWGLARTFDRIAPSDRTLIKPRSVETTGSQSGQRGGTYGYMSPEQLVGDDCLGPASDIFSLGATLYEILTGRPPFDPRDPGVAQATRSCDFARPRTLEPAVPRGLEAICLQALQRLPSQRYATATLMAADLRAWARDDEISADPDTRVDRLYRLARRHRGATVVALVAALVAVVYAVRAGLESEHAARELALRERIQLSFTTALNTFEEICQPLANNELNNLNVLHPLAKPIEQFTTNYFSSLEDALALQVYTGRVYELSGTVARIKGGETERALEHFKQAEHVYAELARGSPDDLELQRRLASVRVSQGQLWLLRGDVVRAEEVAAKACDVLEHLKPDPVHQQFLQRTLAEAYHLRGQAYLEPVGRLVVPDAPSLSEDFFLKGKKLREVLVRETTGDQRRDNQRDLARSLGYLGDVYLLKGDIPQATVNFEESRDLRRDLYQKNQLDPEYRLQYARGLANFSYLERGYGGHLEAAWEACERAREIQQKLVDEFPKLRNFELDLAATLAAQAEIGLFLAEQQPDRAVELRAKSRAAVFEAAALYGRFPGAQGNSQIDLSDQPRVVGLALSLTIKSLVMAADDPVEATRTARQAVDLLGKLGDDSTLRQADLFTLAMAQSLCGKKDEAWRALDESVRREANYVVRFEQHRRLAFRALAEDELYGPRFEALVVGLREKLKLK